MFLQEPSFYGEKPETSQLFDIVNCFIFISIWGEGGVVQLAKSDLRVRKSAQARVALVWFSLYYTTPPLSLG